MRLPHFSRRTFLRTALTLGGGAVLTPPLTYLYAHDVELHWPAVERVSLSLPRLPAAFTGLTIAQISDIHLGPYISAADLRRAVDIVVGLQPQMIVLTGDHVSRLSVGEAHSLTDELSRLSAPEGMYAILGNHDWWTDAIHVAYALRQAGITVLQNANVALHRDGQTLYLAGLDDCWEAHNDLTAAMAGLPVDAPVILLVHEPDVADQIAAAEPRILLQLSGHTHGGQVRVACLKPFAAPYLGQKYPNGRYTVGAMQLYVNRGIGTITPPVRLGCRPEVTLLTLTT